MSGPRWIKQWISDMAALNEQFRNDDGLVDFDALGREEYSFRVALITKKFAKSERAREIYRVAKIAYDSSVENGKKGGRPKKSPQDAPNGNAGVDMSDAGNGAASKSPTSCDQFTADGDTREDSQAKPDGSAITRNETRAHDALEPSANHYGDTREHSRGRYAPPSCSPDDGNIYGDAATREGADVSTTVSRNMRRVPQTEAPAHGFSGGRTAQGTMSRSPEAAAQSGKDYDQEPSISTNEARKSQALESQGRAGADSVRGTPSHRAPARPRASFRNKEYFIQWAIDDGLDPVDAGECWEATEERGGKDADGNTVKNMKAFARQWCRTRASNRRTA